MNTQTTQNPINNTNPNFLTGLGHGFLSLFSLGDVYDVNGDLNKASSDASQNIQNTINKMSLACFKSENEKNQSKNSQLSEIYLTTGKFIQKV